MNIPINIPILKHLKTSGICRRQLPVNPRHRRRSMLIAWGWSKTYEKNILLRDEHWWTCMNPSYFGLRNQDTDDTVLSGLCIEKDVKSSESFRVYIRLWLYLSYLSNHWNLVKAPALTVPRRGLWASSWRGCLKATRQCLAGLSTATLLQWWLPVGNLIYPDQWDISYDLTRPTGDFMGHI